MSSPKKYRLEEFGGNEYPSLSAARHPATNMLADILTYKIHAMLQNGDLTIENGIIVPAKARKSL